MTGKKYDGLRKSILILAMLGAGMLTACGRGKTDSGNGLENETLEAVGDISEENAVESNQNSEEENGTDEEENGTDEEENGSADGIDAAENARLDELKKRFGESCIAEQTFEVTLSEYDGKVWFVPFYSPEDEEKFSMQIIRDSEVLSDIHAFVPENLTWKKFSSLDAVSFFDVNYDGNTDIVLIETYGNKSFAVIYYGYGADAETYERYFIVEEQLSERISGQVENLSIPEIRGFLTEGKENGKFFDYREAYEAISRLCDLESAGEMEYNLIYFDDDDIPELVAGVSGNYTSMYTYSNGTIYRIMNRWTYGGGGNLGYEYSPKRNSLRNYNHDYAGAIMYTTYMTIGEGYSMDTVVQIVTYNFDDVNQNELPDEDEMESMGVYGVSYIDGLEASTEECASYDLGNYAFMAVTMNQEELKETLSEK